MKKLLILLLISQSALGQAKITLIDADDGSPVEAATVTYNDQVAVTDSKGNALIKTSLPVNVIVNALGFKSAEYSLTTDKQIIQLTPTPLALEEVVVTGTYVPQSAKNAVYKVRNISQERIQAQGANTIQEVLSNELNIRFGRDNALGTSGISLQGVSGQNVKVLIDGVPVVGRSGVANEIDINQLNINSIERIEIVEGPMAVNYGADALAGVINLITKKSTTDKLNIGLSIQEETVEQNYALFDEGIHNAQLTVGGALTEEIYVQAEGRINTFGGWIGDTEQFTDRNRQWYPKQQYFGGGLIRYTKDKFTVHYRADFLQEHIQNLGAINDIDPNSEPFSSDQEFSSNRSMHQLQVEGNLGNWLIHPVLSFTNYERVTENFTTFLVSDLEFNRRTTNNTAYQTFFFRNTASNTSYNWGSLQLGIEATVEQGSGSSLSDGNKFAEEVNFFASSEINVLPGLAIRPGVRYGYNNLYSVEPSPSINIKYDFNPSTQLRLGYGRGFRAPSLRELYHEFIDANHNIIGNPELTPEYSHNINADLTKQIKNVSISVSGFYNQINDRITFFTPQESNAATTYLNLTEFQSTGTSLNLGWKASNLQLNAGAVYIGRYQQLNDEVSVPSFIFNWEANTNLTYTFPKSKTAISAFYKYNGPLEDYRLVDPDGDGEFTPELQGIESFHWLDLTISQPLGKQFTMGAGIKNLFNITAIDNNYSSEGAHGGTSGSTSVGFGRSYFLRINYQLTVK